MKKRWSTLFYLVIVAGLGFAIYWIARQGNALQSPSLNAQQAQAQKI
jgi:cytoskeletal protein RodZ